ncbi:MAG: ThuA domain-containing protein [Acidobacteriia bacterium]|nr:ThuA domain-containing protein [Terriglobia bacterium]
MIRFLAGLLLAAAAFAGPPVRVLIVTGGHEHSLSFYSLFDDPSMIVAVNPHPIAFTTDFRDRADVLVLYDLIPNMPEEEKRNHLRAFVESGKGVVVLHHAIIDHQSWPWWYEDVVGGRYLLDSAGGMPASKAGHEERMLVTVAKKHPVTEGLADFAIEDETYKGMWISPKVQVLLTTDNPNNDAPVVWLGTHPKARVVYIQLGHGSLAHHNPNYQRLVRNAILWAAGN